MGKKPREKDDRPQGGDVDINAIRKAIKLLTWLEADLKRNPRKPEDDDEPTAP